MNFEVYNRIRNNYENSLRLLLIDRKINCLQYLYKRYVENNLK